MLLSASVRRSVLALAVASFAAASAPGLAAQGTDVSRLKDVVNLQGYRPMPLVGYGLVVGLNKTGDKRQTIFSTQSLANMLSRFGVVVPADQMKVENIAAVVVTAELSPYQRAGARLDVVASSIGDARSLQGGTLLPTSLRGPRGEMVALAQGPLSIGGFGGGTGGSSVQVNHLTVGRIPGGAIVQTSENTPMPATDTLTFAVIEPDFVTASHVVHAINTHLGTDAAHAIDPGSIQVQVPDRYRSSIPEFMADLESLPVETDVVARVVINERTGTVVVGGDVRLGPAAVAHGNLSVRISTKYEVSQPAPFSPNGQTVVVPNEQVDIHEGNAKLVSLEEGATLDAVAGALNTLGATPRDIIAIMQALKAAGALHAEIVIL
jgi:flagellar P-ring protein precursor FlgI